MLTIWKYPLRLTDVQDLTLPAGAEPMSALMQGEQLVLYVKVDTAREKLYRRRVLVVGTGGPLPGFAIDEMKFVGTVLDRQFVWHVFVEKSLV